MTDVVKYKTLDQLLDDYKQDGVDSEGQFTLNPERARELLKKFQLPDPAHYALHLLSFLVGAGAERVSVEGSRKGLRFEAKGARVAETHLRSPFAALLDSKSEPHLMELALGLNALLGQSGGRMEIRGGGFFGVYTSKSLQVRQESCDESVFVLQTQPLLGSKKERRELRLIEELFAHSPVPIEVEGSVLSPLSPLDLGLEIHLRNPAYPVGLGHRPDARVCKDVKAPFGASIKIGRGASALRIVHLGRCYHCSPGWSYFLPGWRADITLNGSALKKDLSQQELLRDERFENLLGSLRHEVEQATELVLTTTPPISGTRELVDDLVEELFLRGEAYKALAIQENLVQSLSTSTDTLWKNRSAYRLALMQHRLESSVGSGLLNQCWDALKRTGSSQALEPAWSIAKAQMVFKPSLSSLRAEVESLALEPSAPAWIKERCYRWLSEQRLGDLSDRVSFLIELARQVFESGRSEEALEILERVMRGPDGELLDRYPTRAVEACRLHGEIAVATGQDEKAVEMFGKQLALLREQHGQYGLSLGLPLERIAYLLEKLGRKREAREYRAWSQRLHREGHL